MKTEISLEVYKALTLRLEHEQDSLNHVIGRLLGLPGYITPAAEVAYTDAIGKGVRVPVGTELRATYKNQEYSLIAREKGLDLNGTLFTSVSGAAIHVSGGKNTNGWNFWRIQDPTGKWHYIRTLR